VRSVGFKGVLLSTLVIGSLITPLLLISAQATWASDWIIYDNNNPIGAGGGSPDYTGFQKAVLFTPPYTPCKVISAAFQIGMYPASFKVHVTDAAHADLVTPFQVTPTSTGWFDVDLSSYNITPSGDFFIAIEWINPPSVQANPFLSLDSGPIYMRSYDYYLSSLPDDWEWGLNNVYNYYIRAEVTPISPAPAPVGGIAFAPDKLALLAPYIILAALIAIGTVSVAVCWRRYRK
jgi:hypothetical protein